MLEIKRDAAHNREIVQRSADRTTRRRSDDLLRKWGDEVMNFQPQANASRGGDLDSRADTGQSGCFVCIGQKGESAKRLGRCRRAGSAVDFDTAARGDKRPDTRVLACEVEEEIVMHQVRLALES